MKKIIMTALMAVSMLSAFADTDNEMSREELAAAYEALSRELGLLFVDTVSWGIPTGSDGIHFTGQGHRLFALKLGQTIRALLR